MMSSARFKSVLAFVGACIFLGSSSGLCAKAALEKIPARRASDLRVFIAGGKSLSGLPALEKMQKGTDFSLWVAGNQFFAMPAVLGEFQKEHPEIKTIGLITLPPGKIAQAILKGGWSYRGHDFSMRPDFYTTVDLKHLELLKRGGFVRRSFVYLHNQLALMVAKGNPKHVGGIADLGRKDLRVFLPNPIDEGIMSVYGEEVLKRHHLWKKLTGGKSCAGCRGAPNVYFTRVHHREIPRAINSGRADVGLVWATENAHAIQKGDAVEGVQLPVADSLKNKVNYIASVLSNGAHRVNAEIYAAFLRSAPAQEAYARFGFAKASPADFKMRPIPGLPK